MDNFHDTQKLKGRYSLTIRKPNGDTKQVWQPNKLGFAILKRVGFSVRIPFITGNWSDSFETPNQIVNDGLEAAVGTTGVDAFDYLALGTSSTAVSSSDSSLGSELTSDGLSRAQGTTSKTTTNVTNDTHEVTNTFTYSGNTSTTVEELGAFDSSSGGTMFSRTLTGGKAVDTNGETIDVTFKVTAS